MGYIIPKQPPTSMPATADHFTRWEVCGFLLGHAGHKGQAESPSRVSSGD